MSNISLTLTRAFFFLLTLPLITGFVITALPGGVTPTNILLGLLSGMVITFGLMAVELLLKRVSLRFFNTLALGLLCGVVIGYSFLLVLEAIFGPAETFFPADIALGVRALFFLSMTYFCTLLVIRSSDEFYVSIPFVRLSPTAQLKKDLLLDTSALLDPRIVDLASSGLIDQRLMFPRFLLKELYEVADTQDEAIKIKTRRSLEILKKLEEMPDLGFRYVDTDFLEIKDPLLKLTRLARLVDANIITADINRIQQSKFEGIRIINLHLLSQALKPVTHAGEYLGVKVQRYGKEARQGVGYLEDGTMVVINGGANFLGEMIQAQVLSVKHTSSGRMIFCNAPEWVGDDLPLASETAPGAKHYFAGNMPNY